MSTSNERIEKALKVLYEEGMKSYNDEYKPTINRFQAIGMAISRITRSKADVLRLAYEALEDWNFHSTCAILDWICPALHEGMDYEPTLQQIKSMIDRESVTVYGDYDYKSGTRATMRYKVEVVLTKLEDDDVEVES